jgi:spore coat polysaccharide biosynthesis protein SpsF
LEPRSDGLVVLEASIAVVVQVRMGSTRLPGKSLKLFGESTVLQHQLKRLQQVRRPLALCVATSERSEDDAIATACEADGIHVVRGSAEDVLSRFVVAIDSLPAPPELVLRVCADRPLLCPLLIDELLDAYDELGRPDYLSNNLTPSYPDGLDVELARTEKLLEAADEAADPYEREHVTPFLYRRPERFSLAGLVCPFGNYSHVRVALDTIEDYERLLRLHGELATLDPDYDYRDMLNLTAVRPELAA